MLKGTVRVILFLIKVPSYPIWWMAKALVWLDKWSKS